jgi:hypothetical protein
MAQDDDTGVDPVSNDGEGSEEDRLAAQRKKRQAKSDRSGGSSMASRAANGQLDDAGDAPEQGEEDDGQFVWEQGRKVTLANIIARGTPVEHHFVFGGRRTRGTGGLMGFDAKPLMIVSGTPGNVVLSPSYDDDGTVVKVAIENHVKAKVVTNADTDEGIGLIAHILDARGYVKSGKAV